MGPDVEGLIRRAAREARAFVFTGVRWFFTFLGNGGASAATTPNAVELCSSVFQRFVALGRTCWLVSREEDSRFMGLQLDTSRLPPREAVLTIRDWHVAASPWNPEPGAPQGHDALLSLTAAVEEGRVLVYEQRRPAVHYEPLEPTDLTDMLDEPGPEPVSHWVEVQLVDEHGEPRAGEPYRVLLGDNTEVEGKLDRAGVARLPGLPPGPCEWFFPALQPGEWARA